LENGRQQREREIDLLDLVLVLLKRKRLIACVTVGAAVLAAVFSLLLPPVYRAETKILPPQRGNTGMASQIINQFGTAAGLFGAALPVKPPGELYVGMLQARTVVDRIIDRFGLIEAYGMKFREGARKKILEKVLSAEMEKKSGIIVVTVEDRDPKRAAEMANAFVEELKLLTIFTDGCTDFLFDRAVPEPKYIFRITYRPGVAITYPKHCFSKKLIQFPLCLRLAFQTIFYQFLVIHVVQMLNLTINENDSLHEESLKVLPIAIGIIV